MVVVAMVVNGGGDGGAAVVVALGGGHGQHIDGHRHHVHVVGSPPWPVRRRHCAVIEGGLAGVRFHSNTGAEGAGGCLTFCCNLP